MQPIEQSCFWLAQRPPRAAVPLEGALEADIAIIGAGFTGFWTALHLKALAPNREVVIVEQGVAAYGASGRNAGMLGETIDHSHLLAIEHFGLPEARRLAAVGQRNISELTEYLLRHSIACDYEPVGRLTAALTPRHLEEARRGIAVAQSLGVSGHRLLDAAEMRAELDSPLYVGGVFTPGGGILDPVKLVDGLRREAEALGVRVFERSRVTGIDERGAAAHIASERGSVTARRIVLATNAYSHQLLPELLPRFIPLYDYVLVSEPLATEQLERIGWRARQGVTDGRTFFNYYRLTADNRILWGTSEAQYFRRNEVSPACDHSPSHYLALRASFRRHFPTLAGLEFPYAWGGPIASTTRLTPFFGAARGGRVVYGLGYTGHGLGSTHLAGKILAHLALEVPSELIDLALVRRPPFPYPPEPLRGLAVDAVTRALRKVDAGEQPGLLLKVLDRLGIGFSS